MTWLYEWLFEPLFISAQRTLSFNNDTTFSNLYILLLSAVSLTFIDFFSFDVYTRHLIGRLLNAANACLLNHYVHSLVHLFIYICLPISCLFICLLACLLVCYLPICLTCPFYLSLFRFIFLSFAAELFHID